MRIVYLFICLSMMAWSAGLPAEIKGLEYDVEYHIRTISNRGYINQYENGFVISNGLRTRYVFERAGDSLDEVYIRVLPRGNYVTAFPTGRVGFMNHTQSWERFKVRPAPNGFSFQSAHGRYLMADFDRGLLSLSPGHVASTWEDFTLEPVFNDQGVDERGFNSAGKNEKTNTFVDERGFNSRGFNVNGLPDLEKASEGYNENRFLKDQKKNFNFIHFGPELKPLRTPNIYLIIIDTMRADFVNRVTGPNLLEFKNQSVHTDIALSGSTTTHPSLYSLFHSRPSYELMAYAASGALMGPLPLNILKYKLGYSIKATGKRDMGCLDIAPPPYYPISQVSYLAAMQFRFGLRSYLLDDCVTTGFIGNETLYTDRLINLDKNIFAHFLDIAEKSKREKTLIVAHLEGAHTPYLPKDKDKHLATELPYASQRNYGQAFHKVDRWFGKFVDDLKKRDLYDDALIVVLGDHGEELFGPPATEGNHGSYPVGMAQTRIPLYFKFPKNDMKNVPLTKVSTLADVFPTIFEYLGVWRGGFEQDFTGRPITDLRTHVVPISRVNPDNEMAFYAYPYKLNVKYRPQQYVDPNSMNKLEKVMVGDFRVGVLEDFADRIVNPRSEIQFDPRELANFQDIFPWLIAQAKVYPHEDSCSVLLDPRNRYPINSHLDFSIRQKELCLSSTSLDEGSGLRFEKCDNQTDQRFEEILLSDGSVQIRSKASCRCIGTEQESSQKSELLYLWDCHQGPSQQFKIESIEGSRLRQIRSNHTYLCVENEKQNLIQSRCTKNDRFQQFELDFETGNSP